MNENEFIEVTESESGLPVTLNLNVISAIGCKSNGTARIVLSLFKKGYNYCDTRESYDDVKKKIIVW